MGDDRLDRHPRLGHEKAMARGEPVEIELGNLAQRRDVGRHVAVGRIDDDRGRLHHVVAGEERLLFLEQVAEVIACMPRRMDHREMRPFGERDPFAAAQRHVGGEGGVLPLGMARLQSEQGRAGSRLQGERRR